MNIRLRLDDTDADLFPSLYRWLRDDEVAREATITLARQHRPTEMGSAVEFVDVLLSNGIALSSLLVALAAWRGSRPRPPAVRIELGDTVVLLRDDSSDNVRRIVEALGGDTAGGDAAPPP
ncbi:effector-associated constant component EACC1 [Virgisporangium aurantiacum]|uniref:Uncharacterized protein n=1 Tax=Virgisporangium aurantiacum TaxID=175570 RepID=A0A8J3ZN29_9ACTN|nr:hypothetical protein [Virgisporangium aurantiacum]GIJ64643.1 hypothetical protein Vau01_121590 [Virgisporangium aurantiacum]